MRGGRLNALPPAEEKKTARSGNPDIRISGFSDIQISGYPDIRIFGIPDFRISGILEFRISGIPDFRISGIPDFRISGIPEFRIPGNPDVSESPFFLPSGVVLFSLVKFSVSQFSKVSTARLSHLVT